MKNKVLFFMAISFVAVMAMKSGALAGVEPSPFNDLVPLIEDFEAEIAKANENFGRFENSKSMNLYVNTSIPAMQNLVKHMKEKAGIIGDCGNKTKIKNESEKAGVIGDCGMQIKINIPALRIGAVDQRVDQELANDAAVINGDVLAKKPVRQLVAFPEIRHIPPHSID